jgi:hypothetical protein
MMAAVDADSSAGVESRGQQRRQPRAGGHRDVMGDSVAGQGDGVDERARTGARDVLDERAAGGDVEDLGAAADGEERQIAVERRGGERQFDAVAFGVDLHCRVARRLAVAGRIDVHAAGEQEAVAFGERGRRTFGRRIQLVYPGARLGERAHIVGAGPGDGDAGTGGHERRRGYMRAGTAHPIRSRLRVSWRRR